MKIIIFFILLILLIHILNYHLLKILFIKSRKWDLNICCGKTDGGGINADIVKHGNIPNFYLIKDIYHLPFKDKEFKTVLCSHTIEHVNNPQLFFKELQRVGKEVILITPPLWDLFASLNFPSHKWIILSNRRIHKQLPKMIPFKLGLLYDKYFGNINITM